MSGTLALHFGFVIARCGKDHLSLTFGTSLLHCDKASRFRHKGASAVGFVVHGLIVLSDNSLVGRNGIAPARFLALQGSYQGTSGTEYFIARVFAL
jgi:hypothetical protein